MILRSNTIALGGQGSSGGQPRQITSSFLITASGTTSLSLSLSTARAALHLLEIICGYSYITLSGTLSIWGNGVTKTYVVTPTMVGSSILEILMIDPEFLQVAQAGVTAGPVTITLSPNVQAIGVGSYLEVVYAYR